MKQKTQAIFKPIRSISQLLLVMAVLGGSVSTASALGKRSKPWASKSKAERTSTPSGNVAAATNKNPRKGLFGRGRETSRARAIPAARQPQPQPQPRQVQVQVQVSATTTQLPPSATARKRKREGLLVRLFGAERPQANVAVVRAKKVQPSPAPNRVQAPPKFNHALIRQAKSRGSSVVVNIARQRAYVYIGGEVAIDTPVSTARSDKWTPRGSFGVGEKIRQGKISTIYNVGMPYWMRLGSSAYGMHAGYLPGYPASAGCIRMPYEAAQKVYDSVGYGTSVKIISG